MKTWLLALAIWNQKNYNYRFMNVAIKAETAVMAWRKWIEMHRGPSEDERNTAANSRLIGSWELTPEEVELEKKESW